MGRNCVEARQYSYAGHRLFGDGIAWTAINNADKPEKPTVPPVKLLTFNGLTRDEIGTLYSMYKSGQIPTKADLEKEAGMPLKRIKRLSRFIERR